MADTRGCYRCCVVSNSHDYHKYLCAAMPSTIMLMQWYDPLNKFMLLKVSATFVAVICTVLLSLSFVFVTLVHFPRFSDVFYLLSLLQNIC